MNKFKSEKNNLIISSLQKQASNIGNYFLNDDEKQTNKKQILEPEPYIIRKDKLVERTKPKTARTMKQIFEMPSKYSLEKKDDEEFSLTAVVSLYRRTNMTKRWINALVNQTHPPKIIWIVHFASPISKILDQEIEEARLIAENSNITVFVNKGEMQLKYFGRFQLALQSTTKYVVIFDDDCVPQKRFLE
ncbi:unnamed protein product, partial [Brachionus calyciflorus]